MIPPLKLGAVHFSCTASLRAGLKPDATTALTMKQLVLICIVAALAMYLGVLGLANAGMTKSTTILSTCVRRTRSHNPATPWASFLPCHVDTLEKPTTDPRKLLSSSSTPCV